MVINGLSSPPDIANAFKEVYENIFRAGFTSSDDIQRFRIELNQRCESETFQRFTPVDVIKACLQLNSNKKDADLQLFSDAIINAPHDFFVVLCTLINAIIFHGHVPAQWLSGTIIPFLKSANIDKSVTSSYRPITLSSLFGKIVDIFILDRYHLAFSSCDMQFGFKRTHSTTHCTHVVKEVIKYYMNNESEVFASTIDIQKAFDRVDLIKLFNKLLIREFPVHIVRILFLLYSNLCLTVMWNGAKSLQFYTLNGVKQGGICSPYLFNIFINDMLLGLQSLHVGCYVGHIYFGCVAYTDDVVLLAPSLRALRLMLQYCSIFADCHNVLFNPAKSHCIQFCSKPADVVQYSVYLQGQQLTWVERVTHLGHVLSANTDDGNDIRKRMSDFVCQANYFLAKFGHLSVIIRSKLFANFCQSYYGCQLWPLTHKCLLEFDVAWRKVIRRVWHLPRTSHNVLLPFFLVE